MTYGSTRRDHRSAASSALQASRALAAALMLTTAATASASASAAAPASPAGGRQTSDFPTRTVRIVVPFPAGGTADVLPRIVAEKLEARWGQAVIIENKPGAGGNIGAEQVARAEPDGHTLLASPPGPLAINHNLYRKLNYDPTKLVPVSVLATVPNVLAVRSTLPSETVGALVESARKTPGKLTYASQGNGSTSHLTANMFQTMADVEMLHVPYKGTAPALTDLIGGQVDLFFDNLASSLPHHRNGRLKILAVASPKRHPTLPEVPTVAEAALPGFASVTWFGVAAPAGTPAPIVATISAAIDEVLKMPEVQRKFEEQAAAAQGGTPSDAANFFADEARRWQQVIRKSNVTVD